MKLAPKRTHADLKNAVMKACNLLPGVFLFPAGSYAGRAVYKGRARFIKIGMVGVSDLIGWQTHERIKPFAPLLSEKVPCPRFLALEIKVGKDQLRPEQRAFLDKVREAGGIALEVRSVEQAVEALR